MSGKQEGQVKLKQVKSDVNAIKEPATDIQS